MGGNTVTFQVLKKDFIGEHQRLQAYALHNMM